MISWKIRPMCDGGILELHDGMTGLTLALMFNTLDELMELLEDMLKGAQDVKSRQSCRLELMSSFVKEFPERF